MIMGLRYLLDGSINPPHFPSLMHKGGDEGVGYFFTLTIYK